jgi:tape measure domain-containing protein
MAIKPVEILIRAKTEGDAEIANMAQKLESLAQELDGDLKAKALAAAAALRTLGEKQAAVDRFIELKTGAKDAATRLSEAQDAAQKLGREMAASGAPTAAQTRQLKNLGDAVRAAKADVIAQNAAVIQSRAALQQMGISTVGLSQTQATLRAAVGAAKLEINALIPAYGHAAQAATDSANQQKKAAADAGAGVANIGSQLQKIQEIAMIAVGGGFLGGLAKDALYTADAFNNLQARIKIITGSGPLLESSFQGVSEIALRTNSNLEQTSTLFVRIAQAGKSAGMGTKEAVDQSLALTETINQAIQLSGGSVESADAAVTQLIQGLQSGVLRGEEFNSVMEQAPRLAQALAEGLGRTTGELRKMSMEGGLTTDAVIRALRNQADAVKADFANLPPTVGRAIQNLSTTWVHFIGDLDKSSGSTKAVAGAINVLSDNLSTVIKVAGTATTLWAGYAASNVLTSTSARLMASAIAQSAAAATAQEAASAGAAAATRSHGQAAAGAIPGISGYGAAAAGAGRAAAGAAAAGATGFTGLGGAVMMAASKFALWGTVAYVGYGLLKSTGQALGEGIAKWQGYASAEDIMAKQEKELAAATKATADAQYKQAEATRTANNEAFGLSKAAGNLTMKFDALVKGGDTAAEAIGKIGKDFDLSKLPGIRNAVGVLDKLRADGKLTATEFQAAWADALNGKDLAVFETTARAAFSGAKREAELLAQLVDAGLRESIKRTGLDFESLRGGVSKMAQSAVNDTQIIIDGLDRLKAQGVDTGRALTASISKGIDTADTQQALKLVTQQIESMRAKLGETVTNGLLDQAKQKSLELSDALDKAKPGINSVREAMSELGMKSREDLALTAKKAEEAYGVMKAAGLAEGESYEAWQRRKSAAAEVMLGRMIDANNGVATAAVKSRAAMEGLEIQTDSTGKSIVKAMSDGEAVARGLAGIVDGLAGSYTRAGEAALKAREDFVAANSGSVVPTSGGDREKFLAGQDAQDLSLQFSLLKKIQEKTLSAADLADAKAVVESLKVNAQTNRDLDKMGGAFSVAGQLDRMKWEQVQTQLQIFIDSQKNGAIENPAAAQSNAASTPTPTPTPAPAPAATTYVTNVTIPGSAQKTISMTDAASSANLTDILNQLAAARSTAS